MCDGLAAAGHKQSEKPEFADAFHRKQEEAVLDEPQYKGHPGCFIPSCSHLLQAQSLAAPDARCK